jgi:hypothetical protein
MAAASTMWDSARDVLAQPPDAWILVVASAALLTAVVVGTAGFHQVRRTIRHRRVARELKRVHEAAYRERFGQRGRLA